VSEVLFPGANQAPSIHTAKPGSSNMAQGDVLDERTEYRNSHVIVNRLNGQGSGIPENQKYYDEKERAKIEETANEIFNALHTGLAFKFFEKSNEWYAVIENKITQEVIKEIPPKEIMEMRAKLKDMVGFFLDQKI
jgi:flagellar protein FlaG